MKKIGMVLLLSLLCSCGPPQDVFIGNYNGDNDQYADSTSLNSPWGMVRDQQGNLYFVDTGNHRIRKMYYEAITGKFRIVTVAGHSGGVDIDTSVNPETSAGGFADGNAVTRALFNMPVGIALDSKGNLYISDVANQRIRKIWGLGLP